MTKPTNLNRTDPLVINAAVASLKALEWDDTEYSPADADMATDCVCDWMADCGSLYNAHAAVVDQVCREMGINT